MIRQEAILQSPLRFLDRAIRGGLGKGHLGVIMAPVGVGKSACLVEIGLDALLRERAVLHVALGQSMDHVLARYDLQFEALAERVDLSDRRGVREAMARRRLVWAVAEHAFVERGIEDALAAFEAHHGFQPATLLVDGFSWEEPHAPVAVGAAKGLAGRVGAELWMTAREAPAGELGARCLTPFSDACAALVDVGVFLEPEGRQVRLTLVKHLGRFPASEPLLALEAGVLHGPESDVVAARERSRGEFTLLASASAGAEEEFGACAERWGVGEINFSFGGRRGLARTRGLVELSEAELRLGEVSGAYVTTHLHRRFGESPELRRVLQAIWHQVSRAGEVFSVGTLTPDRTAHGGTGWAVELARHWGKPVHLFDQELGTWLRWIDRDWVAEAPPTIRSVRFAGAGTRSPSDAGREAIQALFERSFGALPA